MMDCYEEIGCCLTCDLEQKETEVQGWNGIEGDGCLCYSCLCNQCEHLESGQCQIPSSWLSWEDYVQIAKAKQKQIQKQYGIEAKELEAVFSNGTLEQHVFYSYARDVPFKITYRLKEGYPYRTKTLLLKEVKAKILNGKGD
jgi:hypothetical protein